MLFDPLGIWLFQTFLAYIPAERSMMAASRAIVAVLTPSARGRGYGRCKNTKKLGIKRSWG